MAEKKNASSKKTTASKSTKTAKKDAKVKASETKKTVKTVKKAPAKKETVKKEVKKPKVVDTYEAKLKEEKKDSKFKRWFNNLSLEQIIVGSVIIIAILLIVLIGVSTKNTKTKNGDDIVVQVDGKTITANELYKELKKQSGEQVAINLIDEYILDKEYKTTDEMEKSAKSTIENYKKTYGDQYDQFLQYNGISDDDDELKELLIKNEKLTSVTEDYIKETLTEKEMKKYYDEKIVGDISAKHILISTETDDSLTDEEKEAKKEEAKKKAEEIIAKLKKGEDFDKLAKKYSDDDQTKSKGGDLGYFNTGEMEEAFETAAYKLNVNEYTTTPVETSYGYHIIMKTGQKDKPSYKKSKDSIKEKLVDEKKDNDSTISVKAMIALRKKYNIKIKDKTVKNDYNSYIKTATTTTTTTTTTASSSN